MLTTDDYNSAHEELQRTLEQTQTPRQICLQHESCDVCASQPECVWCGSSSSCIPETNEIQTKSAIVYNSEEYVRTYGTPRNLSETSSDGQCLVWIRKPEYCSYFSDRCRSVSSCDACIQRLGCGYCKGDEECVPGVGRTSLGFYSGDRHCAEEDWIFGNWTESSKGHKFDLQGCNYTLGYNHNAGQYDTSSSSGLPPLGCLVFFTIFGIFASMCAARLSPRLFRRGFQPILPVVLSTAPIRPVDIRRLEKMMPECRPRTINSRRMSNAWTDKDDLEGNAEDLCSVCLAALTQGEDGRQLPCRHLFHQHCIDMWLCKSRRCPVCRQDVEEMADVCSRKYTTDVDEALDEVEISI